MSNISSLRLSLAIVVSLASYTASCDLEQFFNGRQVSIEQSVASSDIVFRGVSTVVATNDVGTRHDVFVAYFDLVNTYKGAKSLSGWATNEYSWVNVTFLTGPTPDCIEGSEIPREYIIFWILRMGKSRRILWQSGTIPPTRGYGLLWVGERGVSGLPAVYLVRQASNREFVIVARAIVQDSMWNNVTAIFSGERNIYLG
ncbi:hypothetical protein JTB14_031752 [Gonioctena quinquepunctata]|nr:hypothetical protein JTB14_031752 [Gonioctena quinquepunctata]